MAPPAGGGGCGSSEKACWRELSEGNGGGSYVGLAQPGPFFLFFYDFSMK